MALSGSMVFVPQMIKNTHDCLYLSLENISMYTDLFLIGIHSMQSRAVTTRHKVTRKEAQRD